MKCFSMKIKRTCLSICNYLLAIVILEVVRYFMTLIEFVHLNKMAIIFSFDKNNLNCT